jgi:cellulose synthase/poly-beta-1,6-N-acetylglucosamine synthase-like glycosyltransferase
MILGYIICIFLLATFYFLLLRKYGFLWKDITSYQKVGAFEQSNSSVSILIPFRNESSVLPRLIDSLNQLDVTQINVEVVFINDHSTDSGCDLMDGCNLPYKICHLDEKHGKKSAIELGWNVAKGDFIFQTDADCTLPKKWLQSMLRYFDKSEVIFVSGPVMFNDSKSFWQKLVALDFMSLIAIGAAHISWDKPLLCNGANMAYRRSLITDADIHNEQASGDDVFLLQSAHKKSNAIRFCKNENAIVQTEGPNSLNVFWNQRLRWSSKNSDYDSRFNTMLLVFIWMFNFIILMSLFSFHKLGILAACFLFIIKILAEQSFYTQYKDFMNVKNGYWLIIVGQLFHIFYMAILPPLSKILSYTWKERVIK